MPVLHVFNNDTFYWSVLSIELFQKPQRSKKRKAFSTSVRSFGLSTELTLASKPL